MWSSFFKPAMAISPTTREETSARPSCCREDSISRNEQVDLPGRHGALGAGQAQPAAELFAIEFLAGAVLLHDQGRVEDGAFVGAEALVAAIALPAAAHPPRLSWVVSRTED